MKVVLVHNRYRSAAPSGENRVVDQEREALTAAGHDVILFQQSSDEIASWPLTKKATLPARLVWSGESYRDLTTTLRDSKPDVVHVHNTFPLLSPAVLYACRDVAIPVVATMHNYRLMCASGDFFRLGTVCHTCAVARFPVASIMHGCYRGSRAASLPVAISMTAHRAAWRTLVSAYVFISASQRDLLAPMNFARERVFVAHNLIPRRNVRSESRDPTVMYAGRLDEAKGLRLLMAAWDRYSGTPDRQELRLIIAGAGPLGQEVTAWASGHASVDMVGQLPSDQCAELMARARAVVVPSAWEETFGLVAVEAMALGVPPIAPAHGSFPELISPGLDGVLFSPADPAALAQAFADLRANPERYAAYGARARESYETRFNPEARIKRLVEIYEFAVANPACTQPGTSDI